MEQYLKQWDNILNNGTLEVVLNVIKSSDSEWLIITIVWKTGKIQTTEFHVRLIKSVCS